MNEETFKENYGIEPKRIVDLKALMGDASDNIPGVFGIGEKTALTLLKKWQSLDNIYKNIDEISPKVRYNDNTYFNVELKADMIIGEIEKGTENQLTKNDYNRILREVENEVSNVIEKTFYTLIKAKSDCLRVGNYIAKDCPDYYSEQDKTRWTQ